MIGPDGFHRLAEKKMASGASVAQAYQKAQARLQDALMLLRVANNSSQDVDYTKISHTDMKNLELVTAQIRGTLKSLVSECP